MNAWVSEWMNEWMNERTNEHIHTHAHKHTHIYILYTYVCTHRYHKYVFASTYLPTSVSEHWCCLRASITTQEEISPDAMGGDGQSRWLFSHILEVVRDNITKLFPVKIIPWLKQWIIMFAGHSIGLM